MGPARGFAVLAFAVLLLAGGALVRAGASQPIRLAAGAGTGQDEGSLRGRIGAGKARERTLSGAIARLAALERATARDVAVLEARVGDVQAALAAAQTLAQATQARLELAQKRVIRLLGRLEEVRTKLAALLRSRYVDGEPDYLTVVLHARGFNDLLETASFLQRVQHADSRLLGVVRSARAEATDQRRVLTALSARRRRAADAVARHRDALSGILAGLRQRRDALAQAHAARAAALTRTRLGRRRAEKALGRLLAARAAAAVSAAGPGGPWAIPYAIVQCESGGQNLPPNSAGASGYYQMLPDTWHGLGGSGQAFQSSKVEQDRLAARLWAGGAGARNWVCASLVGVV